MIAKGDVFGRDQPLILHLLDIPPMEGVLNGVVMELEDCALPLLVQVIPTTDVAVAFKDVSGNFTYSLFDTHLIANYPSFNRD